MALVGAVKQTEDSASFAATFPNPAYIRPVLFRGLHHIKVAKDNTRVFVLECYIVAQQGNEHLYRQLFGASDTISQGISFSEIIRTQIPMSFSRAVKGAA